MRSLSMLAAVMLCGMCALAQEGNVVPNCGFEQVQAGVPTGWTLTGAADLDNAQFYAGAMGLRMVHAQPATSTATCQVTCGHAQSLAAVWVRTQGVQGEGAVLRVLGRDGQLIAATTPVRDDSAWHLVQVEFNPGNANPLTLELSLRQATGAAWFDEAMVGSAQAIRALLPAEQARPPRENVALGRPYTLSPPPSYQYCTDEGDYVQLTDGQYTVGYFWTQPSTVGWYLYSPQIVIDLGQSLPIDGIMINCPGGGAAGVMFPQEIVYYVSEDNETYHEVARLTPKGLRQDGKSWYTHRFLADGLKTRGRYVMIFLDKAGSTVFADEVEVYRGDHDINQVTFATPPVSRTEMAFAQYGLTPASYRPGHFPPTPHPKWATPLAGGPIKAILMAFSEDMRDVVELAQRVDMDYVPVQHFSYRKPEALAMLMQEQIVQALPDAEVMVVGGFYWSALPAELLQAIRQRVREGMGLVVVSPGPKWHEPIQDLLAESPLEGDQGVLDLVPVATLPRYHAPRGSHLHLARFGAGRVALLNWQEFTAAGHSLLPAFELDAIDDDVNGPIEYIYTVLAKTIIWAAQRDSGRITAVAAAPDGVRVSIAPGETPATLVVETRDRYFDDPSAETLTVPPQGGVFAVPTRARINGPQHTHLWLRDQQGRVIDFGAAACESAHAARIVSVQLDRPWYSRGDDLRATVTLEGQLAGLTLSARLVDTYGRQIAPAVTLPEVGPQVEVTVPRLSPISLAASLWITLADGDRELDRSLTRVWCERPEDPEEFIVCAWYAWDFQPHAYWGLQWVRDLGVDTYVSLGGVWRAQNAAWANIRHGPENVERVAPANKDESLVRQPCLTDPAYRAKVEERVGKYAASVRHLGVLEWSLGDESTLGGRDYCHSPTCLQAFRRFLQGSYPDLDALNASWGTQFRTWDEVVPATRAEIEGRERLGQWLDHRRYMERLFTDYHAWLRDIIKAQIPQARVGISGTPRPNSYSGHDWWQLMQEALDHLSGYGGIQRELQRSFLRPGTFYSTFLGYDYKDNNEQRARYGPWDLLLHGANGINYYTLMSNTLNCPLLRPDGSFSRHARWFFEEVAQLRAGTARQIMLGRYAHDGIAVHYSPPSVHGATAVGLFDPRDRLRNYQTNLTNLGTILQECHYQYDFIHQDQMVAGELQNYRVLILPWSSCVSAAEAEAIERFVRSGGILVADSFCGVRDDHGAPRAMLDHLFGVHQPLELPELAASVLRVTEAHPAFPDLAHLPPVPVASGCATIEPAGATPLGRVGEMPALFVNQVGDGAAILLNCSFSNYADVRETGAAGETQEETRSPEETTRPIRSLMEALLTGAGVRSPLRVEVEGELGPQLQVSRFTLGAGMLIGALRAITAGPIDQQDLLSYRIALPGPAHLYDVRAGKYLGQVAEVSAAVPRGVARLWAALPYRIAGLALSGPTQAAPGDEVEIAIALTVEGAPPEPHAVHLTVAGPDGAQRNYLARNVTVRGGRAVCAIPLAWNDAPGEWTITARDVISGQMATHRLTVKAP